MVCLSSAEVLLRFRGLLLVLRTNYKHECQRNTSTNERDRCSRLHVDQQNRSGIGEVVGACHIASVKCWDDTRYTFAFEFQLLATPEVQVNQSGDHVYGQMTGKVKVPFALPNLDIWFMYLTR